ncbi:hypothetical protein VPHK469_0095 [Vibrio phage K469]
MADVIKEERDMYKHLYEAAKAEVSSVYKLLRVLGVNVTSSYLNSMGVANSVRDGHYFRGDADEAIVVKDGVPYLFEMIVRNDHQMTVESRGNVERSLFMMEHHHEWIKPVYEALAKEYGDIVVMCSGGCQRQVFFCHRQKGYVADYGFECVDMQPEGQINYVPNNTVQYLDSDGELYDHHLYDPRCGNA